MHRSNFPFMGGGGGGGGGGWVVEGGGEGYVSQFIIFYLYYGGKGVGL